MLGRVAESISERNDANGGDSDTATTPVNKAAEAAGTNEAEATRTAAAQQVHQLQEEIARMHKAVDTARSQASQREADLLTERTKAQIAQVSNHCMPAFP